jgi:hypothetical protein
VRKTPEVRGEVQLTEQPLRLDLLVVRRRQLLPLGDLALKTARLFYEAEQTIAEIKGPTQRLSGQDFQALMVHAWEYGCHIDLADPGRLQLVLLASRLTAPFRRRAEAYGGVFGVVEPGLWRLDGLAHRVYVVETEVVDDPLLRFFSEELLRRPRAVFEGLETEEQRRLMVELFAEVEQLKRRPLARMSYIDYKEFEMNFEESLEQLLRRMSPATRRRVMPVDLLTPEERLEGLKPEERLAGLKLEERLAGLKLEDLVARLKPEEREALRALLSPDKG